MSGSDRRVRGGVKRKIAQLKGMATRLRKSALEDIREGERLDRQGDYRAIGMYDSWAQDKMAKAAKIDRMVSKWTTPSPLPPEPMQPTVTMIDP